MSEYFKVGQIVNTHGIKGEVKVMAFTDDVNNFKRYGKVLIDDKWVEIQGVKFQKDRVILKLEGIDSMNDAEMYKQKYLQVLRDQEPELPEDTYYVVDLVGCTVYDTNGKNLGKIYDVLQTPNNDVYWIEKPKQLLIPVLRDIVLDVNIDEKKVLIRPVGEWQDED
ncbi:MAG: 16S rRNA processing protein RimM [Clostridium sp.]|uniref:Ribosome maturation factor RimM n=1 Tax=Clostridium paraputrificum TaxID=29363 RepID=A0A6N2YZZ6_9CLOT|nr:ribosome maturation factor RimM [Clostridium sp.]MBS5926437.1 16S rRNA processing protein RimM [Clostridium sp.]MBS5985634.1 16S rRNA processing protein RimM [Clostridium sp.]